MGFVLLAVIVGVFSVVQSLAVFFATLNPLEGLSAIRTMGTTYWSAMGVYTAVAIAEAVLVFVLGLIPVAGKFLGAFVQSYTYLAIGCLLGFAVFKKAPELGLD